MRTINRCNLYVSIVSLLLGVGLAEAQQIAKVEPTMRPQAMDSYGKLPLSFEANQGQTDPRVKFLSRGPGYSLFLTEDSAVLSLHGKNVNAALRMKLLGANAHTAVVGADALPGKSNYFVGSDPKQWRTNLPTYGVVKYSDVYPGIDLVYHGNQRLLEYDFVVAPGADPRAIDLSFRGARKLSVNGEGALVIGLGGDEVIERAPVVYQEIGGVRKTLAGRYVLRGKDRVGFDVAEYDRSQALVIDPTLVYSTFLGPGASSMRIAVDALGNAYITGYAYAEQFPVTPGAYQTTMTCQSAFVTKLNAAGSALIYSTFIGGSSGNCGSGAGGLAVDASGNAYIAGTTYSPDFPVTPGAFQTTYRADLNNGEAFVAKLDATGSKLIYSTYLGGRGETTSAFAIAMDTSSGNAYVTGVTYSRDFPTTPEAFQPGFPGDSSPSSTVAFVAKLNASGSALVYSTFLGGAGDSQGEGIAVDAAGSAYVTGLTRSTDFPTTPGALQTTYGGGSSNAFVTKLNVDGSALVYSTLLGGSGGVSAIAIDVSGNAYLTGGSSGDFPTTPGAFQTTKHTGLTVFVSKLNTTGSALVYSTYLGGSTEEMGAGIAVDAACNAYVTGYTLSSDFPTTPGALKTNLVGAIENAFVSKLDAIGSTLLYSTYLGGTHKDSTSHIAVDASGNAYVTGTAGSVDFPTTPGAYSTSTSLAQTPTFVSKFSLGSFVNTGPVTHAALGGPLGNDGWYLGAVTVTLSATDVSNPISATYYSLDGGQYQSYVAPFGVSGYGTHQLLFYSVDTANRQETAHGQTIEIDAPPVSHVATLASPAVSPNFQVRWSGMDATSGVSSYTIYVSDNGGPFTLWLNQTTATQAWFVGYLTHTYGFYCSARDMAGNGEVKSVAEATIHVPQLQGDVNGDGKIDCADIELVKASFGKKTGQTGFNPAADVNKDGVVDVRDLSIVAQKLIPGTKCP